MKIFRILKKKDVGSIGIGAMIVFIAMVLVAGIAASVLIQTSTTLETQALATGRETTDEVASGIAVFDVLGYAASSSEDISKIAIGIRPRAGSDGIDLSQVYVELSDTTTKVVLNYTSSFYSKPAGQDDIFSASVFPVFGTAGNESSSHFGILVMEDADGSLSSATPVINRGDKVYLCVNTTLTHAGISERTQVWGIVVPELGAPGVIGFTTPASYTDNVIDLQ
ncbi:MAG TPA: flagellin [Bacteroidetes bacterium]|nr:flagellin [Bacteroidota bacterium]